MKQVVEVADVRSTRRTEFVKKSNKHAVLDSKRRISEPQTQTLNTSENVLKAPIDKTPKPQSHNKPEFPQIKVIPDQDATNTTTSTWNDPTPQKLSLNTPNPNDPNPNKRRRSHFIRKDKFMRRFQVKRKSSNKTHEMFTNILSKLETLSENCKLKQMKRDFDANILRSLMASLRWVQKQYMSEGSQGQLVEVRVTRVFLTRSRRF